jgi:hypothetical protein
MLGVLTLLACVSGCAGGSATTGVRVESSTVSSPLSSPDVIRRESPALVSGAPSAGSGSYDPADPGRIPSRIPHPAGGKRVAAATPAVPMPDLIPTPPDCTPLPSAAEIKAPDGYPTVAPKIQAFVSTQGVKEVADYYLRALPGSKIQEASKTDSNSKILIVPTNKEGCVSITLTQKDGKTIILKTMFPHLNALGAKGSVRR